MRHLVACGFLLLLVGAYAAMLTAWRFSPKNLDDVHMSMPFAGFWAYLIVVFIYTGRTRFKRKEGLWIGAGLLAWMILLLGSMAVVLRDPDPPRTPERPVAPPVEK